VADDLELEVRELPLDRENDPGRGLARGVRDDVDLDGARVHAAEPISG
jgi:hypothetical protein